VNQAQQSAFELDLDRLRRLAAQGQELSGCLLAACSAHSAQPRTQSAVIKFLMDSGVGVNETDKNGVTPLHRAVRFRSLKAVEVLLAGGADINAIDRRSKSTALHRAVTHSGAPATAGKSDIAVAIARLLLTNGADPTVKNKSGKIPADYRISAAMAAALDRLVPTKPE
jgi:tankyrase